MRTLWKIVTSLFCKDYRPRECASIFETSNEVVGLGAIIGRMAERRCLGAEEAADEAFAEKTSRYTVALGQYAANSAQGLSVCRGIIKIRAATGDAPKKWKTVGHLLFDMSESTEFCDNGREKNRVINIVDFYVKEGFRDKDYGIALLSELMRYAKENEIDRVKGALSSDDKNILKNIPYHDRLYDEFGFNKSGRVVWLDVARLGSSYWFDLSYRLDLARLGLSYKTDDGRD